MLELGSDLPGIRRRLPGSLPGSAGHTISLFSLSKAYGFASWRIGYMVIPERLLTPVKKVQDTILICPPVVSQHAACGALTAGAAYCRRHLPAIAEDLGGNFGADPGFCGASGVDAYGLVAASPCRPGNHPQGAACGLIGAQDEVCDQRLWR